MPEPLTLTSLLGAVGGLAALQFLATLWISERFKAQVQRENAQFLESVKWDLRVREQATKVAEYMSLARSFDDKSLPEQYRRANQLAWELTLWLPADVYRQMTKAIVAPRDPATDLAVLLEIRRTLLGAAAGDLQAGEILLHGPGVGRHRSLVRRDGA